MKVLVNRISLALYAFLFVCTFGGDKSVFVSEGASPEAVRFIGRLIVGTFFGGLGALACLVLAAMDVRSNRTGERWSFLAGFCLAFVFLCLEAWLGGDKGTAPETLVIVVTLYGLGSFVFFLAFRLLSTRMPKPWRKKTEGKA